MTAEPTAAPPRNRAWWDQRSTGYRVPVTVVKEPTLKKVTLDLLMSVLVILPLRVYLAMLLLGGLHHEVDPRIPALGFWQTALVCLALPLLIGGPKNWLRKDNLH